MHIHIHTCNEWKADHEFKQEERMLYRRVWGEERAGKILQLHDNLKNERDDYKIKLITTSDQ